MREIFSSKDMEGLLTAMVAKMAIWKSRPELDYSRVYYVLQGPNDWITKFYYANVNRSKISINCNPYNNDAESWLYFSNYPEYPGAFKLNAHYKSLLLVRETQTSNLLGSLIFPIPDVGEIEIENTKNTAYEEPNKDINNFIMKDVY